MIISGLHNLVQLFILKTSMLEVLQTDIWSLSTYCSVKNYPRGLKRDTLSQSHSVELDGC